LSIAYLDYGNTYHGNALRLMWNQDGEVGELRIAHEGNYIETFEFADGIIVNRINGGSQNSDLILGARTNDFIFGNSGDDQLSGSDGHDVLIGGTGNDYLVGDSSDDVSFLDPLVATTEFSSTNGGWGDEQYERQVADVNGDGRADIIGFGHDGVSVALGQSDGRFGTAFGAIAEFSSTNGGWGDEQYERQVADVNGDGRVGIVGFGHYGVSVALGQLDGRFGTAFGATNEFSSTNGGWGDEQYERRVADVNGDGRADIVGFGHYGVSVALGQLDGRFGTAFGASNEFSTTSGGWGDEQYERRVADVNGDGRADIVGFGHYGVSVALGQSDGRFGTAFGASNEFSSMSGGWGDEQYERQVADVNGDGRADIVGFGHFGVSVALGQSDGRFGTAFGVSTEFSSTNGDWGNEQYERRVADVNGDGRADIVGFGGASTIVSLSMILSNDVIYGNIGDDILVGGVGDDTLMGGTGSDRFVFADNAGQDVIADFDNGLDVIDLAGVSTINSFEDVQVATNQVGDDVEVDLGNGSAVTINNINLASQLDQSDFLFA
ncbi:MAG: FG-GAP-like repeat-containing protein, partial [Pseudomonadota bacterium]